MPLTWTISCFWDDGYLVMVNDQEENTLPMTVSQALDLVLSAATRRLRSSTPDTRDILFDEIKPIEHALTALAPLQALYDSEINFEVGWNEERRFSWRLGDEMNGFKAHDEAPDAEAAREALFSAAMQHFPKSEFALARRAA